MEPSIFKILGFEKTDYFLTGSRALDNGELGYTISSKESDYDYVLIINKRHVILNYLSNNKIPVDYSCYNGGFRFEEDGKQYNIITAIHIEFMAWREALNILKHLIKTNISYRNAIANKMVRYSMYEQLRGLCKSLITFNKILNK